MKTRCGVDYEHYFHHNEYFISHIKNYIVLRCSKFTLSLMTTLGVLLILSAHVLSTHVYAQEVHTLVPQSTVLLKVDMSQWQQKAQAWYTDNDPMKKRRQMREMTRALKRSCYYCHTRNFKGYTAVKDITLQMMVISQQQQIKCADCHQGQRGLSKVGAISLLMWGYW